MERGGFDHAVGIVLAILFSAVMGVSLIAVLIAEYMDPFQIMSQQARLTLRITGIAGGIAGLLSWGLQGFAAHRGFIVRFFYGLFIYLLIFCAIGGLFEVVSNFMFNPGPHDYSLMGLYWASLGSFYTFTLSVLSSAKTGLLAVLLAPGFILALVGPREIP